LNSFPPLRGFREGEVAAQRPEGSWIAGEAMILRSFAPQEGSC
jgi:hypothetical protein